MAKVDAIVAKDKEWRAVLVEMEMAKKEKNAFDKAVGQAKKNKDEAAAAEAMEKSKACGPRVAAAQEKEVAVKAELETMLRCMGNILDSSVPDNDDEDDPVLSDPKHPETNIYRMNGDCTTSKKYNHVDLMRMLDMMDVERGTKVAGGRGYFLKGDGASPSKTTFHAVWRLFVDLPLLGQACFSTRPSSSSRWPT